MNKYLATPQTFAAPFKLHQFVALVCLLLAFSCTKKTSMKSKTVLAFTAQPGTTEYINTVNNNVYDLKGSCTEEGADILITVGAISHTVTCTDLEWTAQLDLSTIPDGPVTINFKQQPGTPDEMTAELTVTKDTVAPTSVDSLTTGSTDYNGASNSTNFTISGGCSEDGVIEVSATGVATQSTTCVAGVYSLGVNLVGAAEGAVNLNVTLKDTAGNTVTDTVVVTKDTVAPTATVTAPQSTLTNVSPITITVQFSEDVTGFTDTGLTLSNATIVPGSFTAVDGSTYTVDVTPTTDGTFSVGVNSTGVADTLSNAASAVTAFNIVYDQTAPSSTGLANDAVAAESKTWTWGCSDTTACTYRYVVDTNPGTNPTGAFGSTTTYTAGGNNTYYLHIQVKDAAGNISATEHYSAIISDLTAPVVSGLSNDSTLTNSKTHTWSCVDASACTYRYVVDQNATTTPGGAFGATTTLTTATGDGTYYLHVQARDAANNDSAVVHVSFVMDAASPALTGLSNDATLAKTKSWSWGCTDTNACTYRHVIDQTSNTTPTGAYGSTTTASQTTGDGTYYLHVQVKDAAGNTTVGHYSVTLDNTDPVLTGLATDAAIAKTKTWTWGCTDTNACTYRHTIDLAPTTAPSGAFGSTTTATQATGDGAYFIHVEVKDPAGNSVVEHYSVTLDNTAPVITGLANDAVAIETKTWNWGCTDASTCTYRYVVDQNATTTPTGAYGTTVTHSAGGNGVYYLHVQAQDEAGNTTIGHYSAVLADVTAPVVSGLSNDSVATNSKAHTWGCVDASACTYRYVVDQNASTTPGGAFGATTSVTTTTGTGTYYLHVQARDAGNNDSAVVHVSFNMDTTAPVLTGLSNDATIAKTKTWTWGCTDTNTCTYRFVVDQTSNTAPTGSYGSTTTASQTTGNGTYYAHVEVKDAAGNTTTGHYSVVLDNTAPVLTGLATDAVIAKTKSWSWGCTDTNTCTYRYTIDLAPTTAPSGAFSSTTTASQTTGDGAHFIHVEATDPAGNSVVGHYSVTLDNTAPVITGLANDTTLTASKTWNWGCTDSSTCTYRYVVDRLATTAPSGTYSATTSTVYSSGYGYYYLHVQAVDEAGNTSAVKHVYAPLNASMQSGSDVMASTSYTGDGTASREIDTIGYAPAFVWIKNRDTTTSNMLFTSATGAQNYVLSNGANAMAGDATTLESFDTLGYTVGTSTLVNANTQNYQSWSFKENANFFDVVTYTGNGTHSTPISHSLGTTPGIMLIKNVTDSSNWIIYHKDMDNGETAPFPGPTSPTRWVMNMNSTAAVSHVEGAYFTNNAPTSTQFTLGSHSAVNLTAKNYVALLFADSTNNVVKTGTYTGNGSATGPSVTTSCEPQWILIKRKDSTGDWKILDSTRSTSNPRTLALAANSNAAETTVAGGVDFNATGFQIKTTSTDFNANGGRYIYLVIGK